MRTNTRAESAGQAGARAVRAAAVPAGIAIHAAARKTKRKYRQKREREKMDDKGAVVAIRQKAAIQQQIRTAMC